MENEHKYRLVKLKDAMKATIVGQGGITFPHTPERPTNANLHGSYSSSRLTDKGPLYQVTGTGRGAQR